MRFKIFIFFLLVKSNLFSQNSYTMSTGVSGFSNNPIFSSSYLISNSQNCINIKSGIYLFDNHFGSGDFAINCSLSRNYNKLGIRLYPNPVMEYSKVKFINTPPLDEIFELSVYDLQGILILSNKETGYNIFQGVNMDFSKLSTGAYIIQISSSSYIDSMKFIKAK